MGYVVIHSQKSDDRVYWDYHRNLARLLLGRGISLDRLPRVRENGPDSRWLYVWPTEAEARHFVNELKEKTEDPDWEIRAVEAPDSAGPIRPLEISFGLQRDGWVFGLAPWTRSAIQLKFPGSCPTRQVFVATQPPSDSKTSLEELCCLAELALPMLTRLRTAELHAFESYQIINPVAEEVVVPPMLLQAPEGSSAPDANGEADEYTILETAAT
jgi:hypothetical protein